MQRPALRLVRTVWMINRYYNGAESNHFDGQRFFNPGVPSNDKTLVDLVRWQLLGRRPQWPTYLRADCVVPLKRPAGLRITSIGHASILIQIERSNILVDPVWSLRASPFRKVGPRRTTQPGIPFDELPPIDAILLTHNHYDHLDLPCIGKLWQRHRPVIYTPLGNDHIIRAAYPEIVVKVGDWWDSLELPGGVVATVMPSYHWSSRTLTDRRMALWGGFFLEGSSTSVYCAGDTAFEKGEIFDLIRERMGAPQVAVLPIGAYAPRWFMASQHITPEESIQIAIRCEAEQVLGVHWATFPLADEPFYEPEERLLEAANRAGFRIGRSLAMRPGHVWSPPVSP